MLLTKTKFWYSNNCLYFSKCADPLNYGRTDGRTDRQTDRQIDIEMTKEDIEMTKELRQVKFG